MPKIGLKCFLGSFVFSLAAVVAVTKAYSVLTQENAEPTFELADIEAKNIKLFTHNEESDDIYEKFKQLNIDNPSSTALPTQTDTVDISANQLYATITPAESVSESTLSTGNVSSDSESSVFYAPAEEATDTSDDVVVANNNDTQSAVVTELHSESAETSATDSDSLKIVDASEAAPFKIPLIHNTATPSADITVSNEAETHQIALTTDDALDNLGTDSKPADNKPTVKDDDFDDDPWEVAEVSNKNATRNQNAEIAEKEKPSGNAVPYKMQDNLLVPIPDDIKKEKNLTPQFSSSAENKKLEDALRRKRSGLPSEVEEHKVETPKSLARKIAEDKAKQSSGKDFEEDEGKENDAVDETESSEDESQSLTDSIAAWFSGSDKKSNSNVEDSEDNEKHSGLLLKAPKRQKKETSMFRKLLGLSSTSKNGIAPSELKLSFQANRAEISGQTLEWIKAFSENVTKYDDVAIEIRIDRSASYELQQKRLKLLYKILANNGVEYQKINIIFTDREPNSFIIRNVRYVTREEKVQAAKLENNPWK